MRAPTLRSVAGPLITSMLLVTGVAGCSVPDTAAGAPSSNPAGQATPALTSTSTTPAPPNYAQWADGLSTPVADPIYPNHGNAGLDVLHYGLKVAWEPTTKVFSGTATLQVRAAADLKAIALDFSHAYSIDTVTVDGAPATGTTSAADKLTVNKELVKGANATLSVTYHGTPTTVPMPSHRSDSEGLGLTITRTGELWTMQEPYGAFTWYPANDQPSDKALYDITVTAPPGWSGIASGTPKGQSGNTFTYTSTDPVATYLTTLAVGRFHKETAKGPHGVPLTYWYHPGKADAPELAAARKTPSHLAWLEKRFGPYPFPTGGIVIVDSRSGMETQQMVTMGGTWPKYDAKVYDGDLLHEQAHQWFGDAVGPRNWKDLWLNEGWAMYAQLLYEQGRDGFSDAALDQWLARLDARNRADAGPPGKPKAGNFAESNVYICPALMLRQIHKQLGDKAFFALARDWVQQHRDQAADRATFIAFVNRHTGRDFTALVNRWLDSPTTPPTR